MGLSGGFSGTASATGTTGMAIRCQNLLKTFGTKIAVDSVCLNVPSGSIMGILGPNGSGKTTLIRMLMNLLLPDRGSIDVLGVPPSKVQSGAVSYLPEERGLYVKHDIWRFVKYMARLKGVPEDQLPAEIARVVNLLDIVAPRKARIQTLSKGNQQKLQIAISLLGNPRMVILDEPFSGLDPENRSVVLSAIRSLAEQGTTVLLATHMLELAENLCDGVTLIRQGQVVFSGSLSEAKKSFSRYGYVAGFMDPVSAPAAGLRWPRTDLKSAPPYATRWRIEPDGPVPLDGVVAELKRVGLEPDLVEREFPSLEDIYLHVAGKIDVQRREASKREVSPC